MANLSDLYQLDPTSGQNDSNSNFAGAAIGENVTAPSAINNALRALGSMTIRAIGYQSGAISSSASTNLVTASSGLVVPVLGANAIASFGIIPGEQPSAAIWRIVEFSSSASLSHGGSLFLTGGASRRTQPGDIGIYVHRGSSDVWKEVAFSRADGALPMDSLSVTTITNRSMSTSAISTVTLNAASASISSILLASINSNSISASIINATAYRVGGLTMQHVLQVATASNANYSTTSSTIPLDNTLPQIDEGLPVLDIAFTPKSAASTLWFHGTAPVGVGAQAGGVAAVFSNSASDAIFACSSFPIGGSNMQALNFTFSHPAGNTTARTYRLRIGMSSGAVFLNGDQTSRLLGGASKATLKVEEIL